VILPRGHVSSAYDTILPYLYDTILPYLDTVSCDGHHYSTVVAFFITINRVMIQRSTSAFYRLHPLSTPYNIPTHFVNTPRYLITYLFVVHWRCDGGSGFSPGFRGT